MEMLELMKLRHSVRQYTDRPIEVEKRNALNDMIAEINQKAALHIQTFYEEPKCFDSMMAHYGKFTGVKNYIALVGPKGSELEERLLWRTSCTESTGTWAEYLLGRNDSWQEQG